MFPLFSPRFFFSIKNLPASRQGLHSHLGCNLRIGLMHMAPSFPILPPYLCNPSSGRYPETVQEYYDHPGWVEWKKHTNKNLHKHLGCSGRRDVASLLFLLGRSYPLELSFQHRRSFPVYHEPQQNSCLGYRHILRKHMGKAY